jgi:hypothetical protein
VISRHPSATTQHDTTGRRSSSHTSSALRYRRTRGRRRGYWSGILSKVVARGRLALRSAAWNLYRFVRSRVPGAEVGDAAEPPDRHTSIELCRHCLEHLMRFRCDAKVLADRIGVTPGQLWDNGVRADVTMINDTDVLIELGGGAMLAARRLDPARHPAKARLSIEPTALPLGRPPEGRTNGRRRTQPNDAPERRSASALDPLRSASGCASRSWATCPRSTGTQAGRPGRSACHHRSVSPCDLGVHGLE